MQVTWSRKGNRETLSATTSRVSPLDVTRENCKGDTGQQLIHIPLSTYLVPECSLNALCKKIRVNGNYTYSIIKCRNNIFFTMPKASKGLERPVRKIMEIRKFIRTGSPPVLTEGQLHSG